MGNFRISLDVSSYQLSLSNSTSIVIRSSNRHESNGICEREQNKQNVIRVGQRSSKRMLFEMIDELTLRETHLIKNQIRLRTPFKIRINVIGLVLIRDFPACDLKLTIYTCTEVVTEIINTINE